MFRKKLINGDIVQIKTTGEIVRIKEIHPHPWLPAWMGFKTYIAETLNKTTLEFELSSFNRNQLIFLKHGLKPTFNKTSKKARR